MSLSWLLSSISWFPRLACQTGVDTAPMGPQPLQLSVDCAFVSRAQQVFDRPGFLLHFIPRRVPLLHHSVT